MFRPIFTIRGLVLLAVAVCAAQTASSGPPASAKEAEFGRFVISGTVPGAATLDVLVEDASGQPLDGGLYELKEGAFESTLSYPLGIGARIHVTALNGKGETIAEGLEDAGFDGPNAGASVLRLESRKGGPLGSVVVSPLSLKIAPVETGEPGLVRYELRAADVDGRAVEVPAEDISWSVTYPEKTDWSPCKSGTNCIEFRVPTFDKSQSRPEVVACVRNQNCLWGATVIDPSRIAGYSAISGGLEHACALTRDSRIFCWGKNQSQELGRTTSELCNSGIPRIDPVFACGPTPREINCPAGSSCRYKQLDAGLRHTCAVDLAGAIWCWGLNDRGQLGFTCSPGNTDPNCAATAVPRKLIVPLPRGFTQPTFWSVSAGAAHTCAVSTVGSVFCWGDNSSTQLGSAGGREPRVVPTSSHYMFVSAGTRHTCAVTTPGDLDCWGSNDNNLMIPTFRDELVNPSSVKARHPGLVGRVTRVAASRNGTCAHSDGGGVLCWGGNSGMDRQVLAASAVADLELGVNAALQTASDNACAISSDLVLCGLRMGSLVQVATTTAGFFDTTVGGRFECGVKSGGEAFCWGDQNEMGQLGDGGTAFHTMPGRVLGP